MDLHSLLIYLFLLHLDHWCTELRLSLFLFSSIQALLRLLLLLAYESNSKDRENDINVKS